MKPISSFEELPDEIILHIHEYLSNADIISAFFNLNQRINRIITQFYRHLNFNGIKYKQLNSILLDILPHIGSHVKTFVLNGNLLNFISKKYHSINFDTNLSLIFPNLQVLTLEYFTDEHLLELINNIKNFSQLVKININELKVHRRDNLLISVLSANHRRLRSITFDKYSVYLSVPTNDTNTHPYTSVEELICNLIDSEMFGDLLKLLPNIRLLHINFGVAPFLSLTSLDEVTTLDHLTDFQLCSTDMVWKFEDFTNIVSKMPYLKKLVFYLLTDDERFLNKKNFTTILPSSLTNIYFFIYFYIGEVFVEVNHLLNTWPSNYITSSCLLNEFCHYVTIHTIPFNLSSINIKPVLNQQMLSCWKYRKNVKNLEINAEFSSNDILMVTQHFQQLEKLTMHSKAREKPINDGTESSQQMVSNLPRLKQLTILGRCELLPVFEIAVNLEHLSMNFNSFIQLIGKYSIRQVSHNRLLRLEVFDIKNMQQMKFDIILQLFTNLRHIILSADNSSVRMDSIVVQALEMTRQDRSTYVCINGNLSAMEINDIQQWFLNGNHLSIEDSCVIDIRINSIHLWI